MPSPKCHGPSRGPKKNSNLLNLWPSSPTKQGEQGTRGQKMHAATAIVVASLRRCLALAPSPGSRAAARTHRRRPVVPHRRRASPVDHWRRPPRPLRPLPVSRSAVGPAGSSRCRSPPRRPPAAAALRAAAGLRAALLPSQAAGSSTGNFSPKSQFPNTYKNYWH